MSVVDIRSEGSECRGPTIIRVEDRGDDLFLRMGGRGPAGDTFWWSMRLSPEQARSLSVALERHGAPSEPPK
jgi:hypothetical protein